MKLGIVGLPNVGKSTLFNSLTKAGALSANYPFATIDPNVGIVSVPDERIVKLGELYHTKKVTPATIEFVDIAGLVKGASKGEGLGNQFLANIREVDAIVHVVRCFEDTNIIHVDGSVDPARDIETINLELIFSDVEILDRRISKIAKQARMDKTLAKELELVEAIKAHLEEGKMARTFEVPDDDDASLKKLNVEGYKKMIEEVVKTYPNFKAVATTLRTVHTATVNDWSALCWADGEIYKAAESASLRSSFVLAKVALRPSLIQLLSWASILARALKRSKLEPMMVPS